jgi:hypothetical protein
MLGHTGNKKPSGSAAILDEHSASQVLPWRLVLLTTQSSALTKRIRSIGKLSLPGRTQPKYEATQGEPLMLALLSLSSSPVAETRPNPSFKRTEYGRLNLR